MQSPSHRPMAFASPLPIHSHSDAASVPAACASLLSLRHAACIARSTPSPSCTQSPSVADQSACSTSASTSVTTTPSAPTRPTSRFWQTVLSVGEDAPAPSSPVPPANAPCTTPVMNITCMMCGVRFRKPGHLNMHWRSVHASCTQPVSTSLASRYASARSSSSAPNTSSAGTSAIPAVQYIMSSSHSVRPSSTRPGKAGRAYACPQCDACFKRGSDRNRHMRMVHAKIRPFECKLCGNHFGRKSFLEAHVLTVHHKLRPFRCECGAAFGQRSSLTRHARKIHNKKP